MSSGEIRRMRVYSPVVRTTVIPAVVGKKCVDPDGMESPDMGPELVLGWAPVEVVLIRHGLNGPSHPVLEVPVLNRFRLEKKGALYLPRFFNNALERLVDSLCKQ